MDKQIIKALTTFAYPLSDPPTRWPVALAGVLCVAASVVASALFLPHQGLWNDEATQLAGLTLGPVEQVRWLAGWERHDFGVPVDRMPPLSYWVDWTWSRAFGLGETAMRWLGVVLVGLATVLVFQTGRRAWGLASGLASGLLFGLSPNVVVEAVEIRAYPLFLLVSAAMFHAFVRYLEDPGGAGRRWLGAMTACAVLAVYTHFFGLLLSGGVFLSALCLAPRHGGRVGPIVLAIAVVGLCSLGVAPFVLVSFRESEAGVVEGEGQRLIGLARLVYRLLGHASLTVYPAALGLAAAGTLAATAAALAPKQGRSTIAAGLTLALVSGAIVVVAAQFGLKHFLAAATTYNVWMVPAVMLLLGSGLAAASPLARRGATAGIVMLVAAYAFADAQLAFHGDFFAHTPHRAVDALIHRFGPARVAVVLDVTTGPSAWHIYSPIRYEYAGVVRQYLVSAPAPSGGPVRVTDYPDGRAEVDPARLAVDYLIVVNSTNESAAEVVRQIREGVRPLGDGPVARALKSDSRWSLVEESTHVAFVAADIDVFKRTDDD
jgi:hypothetical protein